MINYNVRNIGEFTEVDFGHCFTYRETKDSWAIKNGLTHEVDVAYETRFARITKSRCYMCIDEGSDGKPVIEKWKIKNHKVYSSM